MGNKIYVIITILVNFVSCKSIEDWRSDDEEIKKLQHIYSKKNKKIKKLLSFVEKQSSV